VTNQQTNSAKEKKIFRPPGRVFLHNKYSILHHNIVVVITDKPTTTTGGV